MKSIPNVKAFSDINYRWPSSAIKENLEWPFCQRWSTICILCPCPSARRSIEFKCPALFPLLLRWLILLQVQKPAFATFFLGQGPVARVLRFACTRGKWTPNRRRAQLNKKFWSVVYVWCLIEISNRLNSGIYSTNGYETWRMSCRSQAVLVQHYKYRSCFVQQRLLALLTQPRKP